MARYSIVVALAAGGGRLGFTAGADAMAGDSGNAIADALAALPCPAFAMFCDGFESGGLTAWQSSQVTPTGTLDVEVTRVHSGAYALEANMPPYSNDGESAAIGDPVPTQSTGTLSVREWVYMPGLLGDFEAVMYIGGTGYYLNTRVASGLWGLSENSPSRGLFDYPGSVVQVTNKWTCVETTIVFGAPTTAQVSLDGNVSVMTNLANSNAFYNVVEVGAARANAPGLRVNADDVVVAQQHIGCE